MYNNLNGLGIETARAFLEIVKKKNPDMSYSDLWVLAAYVSLEVGHLHTYPSFCMPWVYSDYFFFNHDMSFINNCQCV